MAPTLNHPAVNALHHGQFVFSSLCKNTCISYISVCHLLFPDEAQEAEAIQVLNAIYDMNENQDMQAESTAKISHALAMLYYTLHDIERVSYIIPNFTSTEIVTQ